MAAETMTAQLADKPIYCVCRGILDGSACAADGLARREGNSCRCVEVPWVTQKIRDLGCKSVLDVGISLSNIEYLGVLVLLRERYGIAVEGMDIVRPERVASRYPEEIREQVLEIPVLVEDVREAMLPEERFDAVTLVSVIEHIGFDKASSDNPDSAFERASTEQDVVTDRAPDIDRRVLDSLHRTLKPGGHLLVTVPMGSGGPVILKDSLGYYCAQWEYEPQSWRALVEHPGFTLLEEEFWALGPDGWESRPDSQALSTQDAVHLSHSTGCAMAVLQKR